MYTKLTSQIYYFHASNKHKNQVYFYPNSKNLHISIQLDFLALITLSQLKNLINVSSGFQLEDLISGMNFQLKLKKK